MYAYCNNNPIMYTDESGESITAAIIVGCIIGAVVGGTILGIQAYNAGYTGWDLAAFSTLGAIAGAIIGASLGYFAPEIGAFLGSSFTLFNFMNGAGELVAVSVTGTEIVAAGVAAGAIGMYMFSSDTRPQNNRKQNEQYRAVMRHLGYRKTDWQWRYGHDHLPNEPLGFKQLLKFLINLFKNT